MDAVEAINFAPEAAWAAVWTAERETWIAAWEADIFAVRSTVFEAERQWLAERLRMYLTGEMD